MASIGRAFLEVGAKSTIAEDLKEAIAKVAESGDKLTAAGKNMILSFENSLNPTKQLTTQLETLATAGKSDAEILAVLKDRIIAAADTARNNGQPIDALTQKFYDQAKAAGGGAEGVGGLSSKLTEFAQNPIQSAQSGLSGLLGALGPVGIALGALGGAVIAAGGALITMGLGVADEVEALGNLSTQTGLSIQTLQALQQMSKEAGLESGTLGSTIGLLNKQLASGEAGPFGDKLKAMGISMKDTNGVTKDAVTVLDEMGAKLKAIKDPAVQAQEANFVLGGKLKDLIPLIMGTTGSLSGMIEEMKKSGPVMTTEMIDKAKAIDEKMDALGRQWENAKLKVKEWATTFVDNLGPALNAATIGIGAIVTAIGTFCESLVSIYAAVSKSVTDGIAEVSPKWAAFVDGLSTAWSGLWEGLSLIFGPLWETQKSALNTAWGVVSDNWVAFTATISSAWDTVWGALAPLFSAQWEALKTGADTLWTGFKALWTTFTGSISSIWGAVWTALKDGFAALFGPLVEKFEATIKPLAEAWDKFTGGISTAWSAVFGGGKEKSGLSSELGAMATAVDGTTKAVTNATQPAKDHAAAVGTIQTAAGGLSSALGGKSGLSSTIAEKMEADKAAESAAKKHAAELGALMQQVKDTQDPTAKLSAKITDLSNAGISSKDQLALLQAELVTAVTKANNLHLPIATNVLNLATMAVNTGSANKALVDLMLVVSGAPTTFNSLNDAIKKTSVALDDNGDIKGLKQRAMDMGKELGEEGMVPKIHKGADALAGDNGLAAAAKKAGEEMQTAAKTISTNFTNALSDLLGDIAVGNVSGIGGKLLAAFKNLGSSIVTTLADSFLKPFKNMLEDMVAAILKSLTGISGGVTPPGGGGTPGANGLINGVLNWGGINLTALLPALAAAGLGFSAAGTPGMVGAFMGAELLSNIAASMSAGTGFGAGFSGFATALGAIPLWGWGIIAAVAALGPLIAAFKGKSTWKAGAMEAGRDFGVDLSEQNFEAFCSQGLGLSEDKVWPIRKDILSSPRSLTQMLLPLAIAQNKMDAFMGSLDSVSTTWGNVNLRTPMIEWMKTGNPAHLNEAYVGHFSQSTALQENFSQWKTMLMANAFTPPPAQQQGNQMGDLSAMLEGLGRDRSGFGARGLNEMPQAATGGYVAAGGLAIIHRGENIIPAGQGGPTININGPVYGIDDLETKIAQAWTAVYRRGGFTEAVPA